MSVEQQPALSRRVAAVGEYAPSLAVVVAALYAIGFVVVTSYLGGYGVMDFNPLRPRYVAAALPFLFITFVVAAISILLDARISPGVRAEIERRFGRGAWPVQLLWGLTQVAATFVLPPLIFVWALVLPTLPDAPQIGQLVGTTIGFTILLSAAFGTLTPISIVWPMHGGLRFIRLFVGSVSLLSAAVIFGRSVYPLVPTWSGGGRPDTVTIDLADGLRFCSACGTVQLIDEDAQRIIVLVQDGATRERAVTVERSALRSISHSSVPRP